MKPFELFNLLPLNNKLTLLKYKATLLQAFNEGNNTNAVYYLNGYYVETSSNTKKGNLISIVAFNKKKPLLKFIDSLPLEYLYL